MSLFADYLRKQKIRESLSSPFEKPAQDDQADDYDQLQRELFKTIMSKYPEETEAFLNGFAQRGDQEIVGMLSKLGRNMRSPAKAHHPSDQDEIVPAASDLAHGGGE